MANKREIIDTQRLLELEQEQLVGYWIKQFGISRKTLVDHPQIDDLILLIKFRSEFNNLSRYRQKKIKQIWNYVYKGNFPLKAKHLDTLYHTGRLCIKNQNRQAEKIKKIKILKGK